MKSMVLLLAVFSAGCDSGSISLPAFAAPRAPVDHIAEVKAVAHKKQMYWKISCTGTEDKYAFMADLCQTDCELLYEEDGGKPRWIGAGATQQAAAADLIAELDRYPIPNHVFRREEPKMEKRQCPPELSGGPGGI